MVGYFIPFMTPSQEKKCQRHPRDQLPHAAEDHCLGPCWKACSIVSSDAAISISGSQTSVRQVAARTASEVKASECQASPGCAAGALRCRSATRGEGFYAFYLSLFYLSQDIFWQVVKYILSPQEILCCAAVHLNKYVFTMGPF